MGVTMWQYLPGQKRMIVEDAVQNNKTILFCSPSGYELIDSSIQQVGLTIDSIAQIISQKDTHILCNDKSVMLKLSDALKKRKINFNDRKEVYKV